LRFTVFFFFFSSRRRHTRSKRDWSSDVCSSDLGPFTATTVGDLLGSSIFTVLCLEFNEHFSYGATYNFALSGNAVNGGVAGGNRSEERRVGKECRSRWWT